MLWRIYLFFYSSLAFSICGFIIPTHVTQAIGWNIGDMVHWVYGYYILIPYNPPGEITSYFYISLQGYFLIISAISLQVVSFVELRKAKHGDQYSKNLIYALVILQLIASQLYQLGGFIVMWISISGFYFSGIFSLIGNRELKLFYIDKGIVNVKNERIIVFALITMPLILPVYSFSILLCCAVPYGIDVFSFSSAFIMFSGLIFLLFILIYGISSLLRVRTQNRSEG